jgi:hypothetical protein
MGSEDLTGFRRPTYNYLCYDSRTAFAGVRFYFYRHGWILASGFTELVSNELYDLTRPNQGNSVQ